MSAMCFIRPELNTASFNHLRSEILHVNEQQNLDNLFKSKFFCFLHFII